MAFFSSNICKLPDGIFSSCWGQCTPTAARLLSPSQVLLPLLSVTVCVCPSSRWGGLECKLACAPQQPLVRAVCMWTTPTLHIPQSLSLRNFSLLRVVFRVWVWFWFLVLAEECSPQGRHFLPFMFLGPVTSGHSKRKRS